MPFFLFVLLVSGLACGTLPPADLSLGRAAFASLGMLAGWTLLFHLAARTLARQVLLGHLDSSVATRWLERQLALLRWLGLGAAVFCLAGFGVARGLDQQPLFRDWMVCKAAVCLTPGLVICFAAWSAENDFGMRLGWRERSVRGHLRSLAMAFRDGAAWMVVPVLLLLAGFDLIGWLGGDWTGAGGSAARSAAVLSLLVATSVATPRLMGILFKTRPLEPELAEWIGRVLAAAGVGSPRVRCWDTGRRSWNALVVGLLGRFRLVLVSDRVLDELPRDQLAMVLLHEAAHIRRRHAALRMALLLPAWGLAWSVTVWSEPHAWAALLGTVTGITLAAGLLHWVAHRTELDADSVACRIAPGVAAAVPGVPASADAAAASLGAALTRVTAGSPAARERSWLHPSLDQRLASLRSLPELAAHGHPATGWRHRIGRFTRRPAWLILGRRGSDPLRTIAE